jgi:branched-chain amino acid transport system substrate-binding protein
MLRSTFALVLALVVGVVACKPKSENEIKIGAYLSLSGSDSAFGTDTRDGMALALAELNAAGGVKGKKLAILYEDDKSITLEASQAVRKLIERDNVVALLGEAASGRSLAGGLIANTSQVPMVTPSATSVDVTKNREWVFRTCFTDDVQGHAAARWVLSAGKRRRIAIFYAAQDSYSSGLARSFREEILRLGGEIVVDKGYQKGETSFRTQLAELKSQNPDVIFVPNYYNEMVLVARQAREIGIPGSLFVGGDGWDAANLLEGAGAELEGAHFTNHYAPDVPWPSSRRFLEAFRAQYKREPTSGNALGYDAARLLVDAIGRATEVTRPAIREALAATRDFEGATGTMTVDADRNPRKPVVVVRITNKRFSYASQLPAE